MHAGDYYNMSGSAMNWHSLPSSDLMVKIPPPPRSAGVSSELTWPIAPPPPPPPMMCSSELSSVGYSGPLQVALPPPHPALALGFTQSTFTYEDLVAATGGFSQVINKPFLDL